MKQLIKIITFFFLLISAQTQESTNTLKEISNEGKKISKDITNEVKNLEDKYVPVPVFTPPTIAQLQTQIAAMTVAQQQAQITTLQTNIKNLSQKISDATKRCIKIIAEAGAMGAMMGGALGAIGGSALAAGIALASDGSLTPQACGLIITGAAIGAAGGGAATAKLFAGNKIKECNNQVTEYTKEVISNQTQIVLLNACLQSKMTYAQIQALPSDQIQKLSQPILSAIIPDLTPAQITSLTPTQFSYITPDQIKALTPAQIGGITPAQIAGLSPNISPTQQKDIDQTMQQLLANIQASLLAPSNTKLTKSQQTTVQAVQDLIKADITVLSDGIVLALAKDQKKALNKMIKQIAITTVTLPDSCSQADIKREAQRIITNLKLTISLVSKIAKYLTSTVSALTLITTSQIQAFTVEQMAAMNKNQILAISPLQIQAILPAQFAAISPSIIPSMTDAQIGFVTQTQFFSMTKAQKAQATASQLATLTFIQLIEQIIGFLLTPTACFGGGMGMIIK